MADKKSLDCILNQEKRHPKTSIISSFIKTPPSADDEFVLYDNYNDISDIAFCINSIISTNIDTFISKSRIKQLRILDLGCGSKHSYDLQYEEYSPTICETLHKLESKITGVDIYFPDYDKDLNGIYPDWNFVKLDLSKPDALSCFPDDEFDLVWSRMLLGGGSSLNWSPYFKKKFDTYQECQEFEPHIYQHILRILKPEGILLLNNNQIYKKDSDDGKIWKYHPISKYAKPIDVVHKY